MDEALHRQVVTRRLQVLAEGEHVDLVLAHAVHDLDDLIVGLAETEHQAGLGRHVRDHLLEALQQVEGPLEIRTRARRLVEARYGFQVVVEHIRRLVGGDFQSDVHAAAVVRDQRFQLDARGQLADLAQAVGEVLGTAVAQVVAVHRGDHHVLQAQVGDGDGQAFRLVDVQWLRTAVADVAERATTGADVTHDHEGRGTAGEALAEVRAGGFLAYAVQLVLAQQLLDAVDFRRYRDAHANPVRLLRQFVGGDDLHRNARHFLGATQLHTDFHLARLAGCLNGTHQISIPPMRVFCSL
ncbi:hypothetical protein D3C76_693380 [compost metagenome]